MNSMLTFANKYFRIAVVGALAVSCLILQAKEAGGANVQQKFSSLQHAVSQKEYHLVVDAGKAILAIAPQSPFASEATFCVGVAYFHLKDYDLANQYFSTFLEKYATPNYFEESVEYKYKIAYEFEMGSGRHMFGVEALPKWVNAWEDALEIYEEVIKTLPNSEVAGKALFRKAAMQYKERKAKESIETYRMITRKFPKHPLAPESYLEIAKILFNHSNNDYPDKDFLEQARMNAQRFRRDFPSEHRIQEVEKLLVQMEDVYAEDLWGSAKYFEKKKNFDAARLYLEKIARLYPESTYAKEAVAKLNAKELSTLTVEQNFIEDKARQSSDVQSQLEL